MRSRPEAFQHAVALLFMAGVEMRVQRKIVLVAAMSALMWVGGSPGFADQPTPTDSRAVDLRPAPVTVLSGDGSRRAEEVPGVAAYIIRLADPPLASYRGALSGLAPTSPRVLGQRKLDVQSPAAGAYLDHLESRQGEVLAAVANTIGRAPAVTHRYSVAFNGMTIALTPGESEKVRSLPGVAAVTRDELQQLQTDVSPDFIGAPAVWNTLGGPDVAGEGVVVGVIDSGIWPEHPSFSDPDPGGKAYPAPPSTWIGTSCDFGDTAFNPNDAPFTCNNKLIGATQTMTSYVNAGLLAPTEFDSARDDDGHGSHTAGTAAGNHGVAASVFGIPRGAVSGIAPRAHVAAYKAVGAQGAFTSDLVDAIDSAVADGVDVINYSVGGSVSNPYTDPDALAFLAARDAGVFVATSAGNLGPGPGTVGSPGNAAWITTVGASTTDRHFSSTLTLEADNSDTLQVSGLSITGGISTPTPVTFPPAGQELCTITPGGFDPFPPGTFSGEIVICDRGGFTDAQKSFNVSHGGGSGMLLVNLVPQDPITANHFIPTVHLEDVDGTSIKHFLATHTGVTGVFTPGLPTTVQGDRMAAFSSRGPTPWAGDIIKPDITAPGVQILAAHTPKPAFNSGGLWGELFQSIQGTSMSSPHVAGAGALMQALHPNLTPAEIESALLMTATRAGVVKEDGTTPADPFDMGSGRLQVDRAAEAGLVLDETRMGYLDADPSAGGDPTQINRASLGNASCPDCSWTRSFSNPTGSPGSYTVTVTNPPGVDLTASPSSFTVAPGGTQDVTFSAQWKELRPWSFGHVTVSPTNGTRPDLHLPVAVGTIQRLVPGYTMSTSITDPSCTTPIGLYPNLEDYSLFADPAVHGNNVLVSAFAGDSPIEFFGLQYPDLSFTDDGLAIFDAATNLGTQSNVPQAIPSAALPNNLAALLWSDMKIVYDAASNSGVTTAIQDGTGRGSIVYLEFDDLRPVGGGPSIGDFALTARRTPDATPGVPELVISFDNVQTLPPVATIGLENQPGSHAAAFLNNASPSGVLADQLAICFDFGLVGPDCPQDLFVTDPVAGTETFEAQNKVLAAFIVENTGTASLMTGPGGTVAFYPGTEVRGELTVGSSSSVCQP